MKLATHILVFILGCGIGIWYGVHHPSQAQNIAAHEQKLAAQAKIAMIKKLHPELTSGSPIPPEDAQFQRALEESQKELDEANHQLTVQQ
jgi:hypothetical protein